MITPKGSKYTYDQEFLKKDLNLITDENGNLDINSPINESELNNLEINASTKKKRGRPKKNKKKSTSPKLNEEEDKDYFTSYDKEFEPLINSNPDIDHSNCLEQSIKELGDWYDSIIELVARSYFNCINLFITIVSNGFNFCLVRFNLQMQETLFKDKLENNQKIYYYRILHPNFIVKNRELKDIIIKDKLSYPCMMSTILEKEFSSITDFDKNSLKDNCERFFQSFEKYINHLFNYSNDYINPLLDSQDLEKDISNLLPRFKKYIIENKFSIDHIRLLNSVLIVDETREFLDD